MPDHIPAQGLSAMVCRNIIEVSYLPDSFAFPLALATEQKSRNFYSAGWFPHLVAKHCNLCARCITKQRNVCGGQHNIETIFEQFCPTVTCARDGAQFEPGPLGSGDHPSCQSIHIRMVEI